jgi:putative transposase
VAWFHGDSDEVSGSPKILADLREDGLPKQVVFHTDEGTQYASTQIAAFATAHGITRSMGRTGVCWDNAMAESFFATLKTEFYYRRVWPTRKQAKLEIGAWIESRYNRRRRHASLGQISPVSFELQYSNQIAELQQAA